MKKFRSLNHVEMVANLYLQKTFDYKREDFKISEHGYKFKWDNKSTKRFGACSPRRKAIILSKKICEVNLDNGVMIVDTILHEIAHAIQVIKSHYASHDNEWKSIAMSIGCNGKARYDEHSIIQPKMKYTAVCPCCKRETGFYKKPKRSYSCGKCAPGRYTEEFKLKIIQNY